MNVGEYFRCVRAHEEEGLCVGDTVFLESENEDEICVARATHSGSSTHFTFRKNEFFTFMEHDPGAVDRKNEEMVRLSKEIDELGCSKVLNTQMALEFGEKSTALVSKQTLDQQKETLKEMKGKLASITTIATKKHQELQTLLEEKQMIMKLMTEKFEAAIEKMNFAIGSINLYLGVGQDINPLKDGEPAPAETKIAIRQMTLYMDEECALEGENALSGGIDFKQIHKFDEWLIRKPSRIKMILPEERCIVGMRIRRTEKDYKNPIINMFANERNYESFLLIRNGERVFRVNLGLVLCENVFPRSEEFDDIFIDEFSRGEDRVIRPGTYKYDNCLKKANESKRRYLQVMLVIQGLLDRTKVFTPMPDGTNRINICDRRAAQEYIDYISEYEKVLTDGRPSFGDWLAKVNSELTQGHRIIGRFDDYGSSKLAERYKKGSRPDSAVYTIEGKIAQDGDRKAGYYFLYKDTYAYPRQLSPRSRFIVFPTDEFIIDFDAASIEDAKYYLNCRLHRHSYSTMVPLLCELIKLKEKEQKEERDFELMLAGQFGGQPDKALIEAKEMIAWFKFKNKTFRAIGKDDKEAFQRILAEREKRKKVKLDLAHRNHYLNVIIKNLNGPDVLLIAHKKENVFVTIHACNNENIFVTERTWKSNKDSVRIIKERTWALADKRYLGWNCLLVTQRWREWNFQARRSDYLSGPEEQELIKRSLELLAAKNGKPIALVKISDNRYRFYFQEKWEKFKVALRKRNDSLSVKYYNIRWERTSVENRPVLQFNFPFTSNTIDCCWDSHFGPIKKDKGTHHWEDSILWKHDENFEKHERQHREYVQMEAEYSRLSKIHSGYFYPVAELVGIHFKEVVYKEFLKDHSKEEIPLYEKQLESEAERRESKADVVRKIDDLISKSIEANIPIRGLTIKQLKEMLKVDVPVEFDNIIMGDGAKLG